MSAKPENATLDFRKMAVPMLVLLVLTVFRVVACERALDVIFISSSSTPEVEAAVQLAVEHVNMSSSVSFNGFYLNLTVKHATCSHRGAQSVLLNSLITDSYQVATIGAGCSEATTGVAELIRPYNIPMLSYASTSQELGDRSDFPNLFRTVPSDQSITIGIVAFIATYPDWTRVVVLTQDTEEYKLETIELVREFQSVNVSVSTALLLPEELDQPTPDSLFPPDHRIFILNMGAAAARFVICEAIKSGLEQYRYVWILQGSYPEAWWTDTDDVDCNATSLGRFLQSDGAIAISYYPLTFNQTTPSDITGKTSQNLSATINSSSPVIHYAYDAVLVLARSLNHTLSRINTNSEGRSLVEGIREGVLSNLNEFEPLQGVSGQIEFENGTRIINRVSVHQYRKCVRHMTCLRPVGTVSLLGNDSMVEFISGENQTELWGGQVPSDGAPIIQHRFPNEWLTITSYVFASLVIMGAVISMIFTCVFRKRKLVRLTSPNMNLVIALGVIIFNSGVFLFTYPELSNGVLEAFCAIRAWVVSVGISLCFGTVNAKMWRIYYIFHNPNPARKKRPLKDWHLLLVVMGIVLVDVILLTTVTIISTARLVPDRVPDDERPPSVNDENITMMYEVTLCDSQSRVYWLVVLFGYKIVIQGVGLFLALRIRNIKIKVLNDSKEIAATLYLSSAILAVVIVISVALPTRLDVYSAAYAYGIPLATSVVLVVVFFTKMWRLFRDPNGEKIFTDVTMISPPAVGANITMSCDVLVEDKVSSLQRQVQALRVDLAKYKSQGSSDGQSGGSVELNETAVSTVLNTSAALGPNPECSTSGENIELSAIKVEMEIDSAISTGSDPLTPDLQPTKKDPASL